LGQIFYGRLQIKHICIVDQGYTGYSEWREEHLLREFSPVPKTRKITQDKTPESPCKGSTPKKGWVLHPVLLGMMLLDEWFAISGTTTTAVFSNPDS
jgi:hypothetical protein